MLRLSVQKMTKLPPFLSLLLFYTTVSKASTSCKDDKCDSANLNDEQALLQENIKSLAKKSAVMQPTMEQKGAPGQQCGLIHLRTSTWSPQSFDNFENSTPFQPHNLYVNKGAKFALCVIEKNACSSWSVMLNRLSTGNLNAGMNFSLIRSTFTAEEAEEVFSDPEATRAVFVRDPLERFLSGFLNKCAAPSDCWNPFCFMRRTEQKGQPISFSQAVEWLREQDTSLLESHFRSQAMHCELYKRLGEYTTLGIMKSQTLAEDASCLLNEAGLSHINVQNKTDSSRFWVHHPKRYMDNNSTEERLASYYTPEAAEIVFNAYREDYVLFNLPKPGWISRAKGELYHDPQSAKCIPKPPPPEPAWDAGAWAPVAVQPAKEVFLEYPRDPWTRPSFGQAASPVATSGGNNVNLGASGMDIDDNDIDIDDIPTLVHLQASIQW